MSIDEVPEELPLDSTDCEQVYSKAYDEYMIQLEISRKLREECAKTGVSGDLASELSQRDEWELYDVARSCLGITNPKRSRVVYDHAVEADAEPFKPYSRFGEACLDYTKWTKEVGEKQSEIIFTVCFTGIGLLLLSIVFGIARLINPAAIDDVLLLFVIFFFGLLFAALGLPDVGMKEYVKLNESYREIVTRSKQYERSLERAEEDWKRQVESSGKTVDNVAAPFIQEEISKHVGYDKYLSHLVDELREIQDAAERIDNLRGIVHDSLKPPQEPQKQDWSFWGGVASAAAGPVCGALEAARIQSENEEEERRYRVALERYYSGPSALEINISKVARSSRDKERPIIETMNRVGRKQMIKDTKELFRKLDITCESVAPYSNVPSLLIASFACSINEPVRVCDRVACLDGVLDITIVDKEGNAVASGVYCAPGYCETDLSKAGFNTLAHFSVVCPMPHGSPLPSGELVCKVKPRILWAIER